MNDTSPKTLELTPDLIEHAMKVAQAEAKQCCPRYVSPDDAAQDALMQLLRNPPNYDPTKGEKKALVYTVIHRAVIKYVESQRRHARRNKQGEVQDPEPGEQPSGEPDLNTAKNRRVELMKKSTTTDDLLEFIDCPESRKLCEMFFECDCNMSEVARRMGISEGTVRYRMKLLGPKLIAAGFVPGTKQEGSSNDDDD
jgi:RNA polymerase sigma factor (sigma-70 family)